MKILLVHNSYREPGGEDVVFEQEKATLERAGNNVIVYHRSNSEIDSLTPWHRIALVKNAIWSRDTRREFSRLLARTAPDLVHVHNTFLMITPSIYGACGERGIPIVQTLHNFRWICPATFFYRDGHVCEDCLESGLQTSIRHGCYRGSKSATAAMALMLACHQHLKTWHASIDRYIALTSFARDKFIAAGFHPDKIVVKPNFVAVDPGRRKEIADYAMFVGRLSSEKGLATLVRAWERLSLPCPLHIVGDGPQRRELEGWVRQLNIPLITFRGSLPRQQTIAIMKRARFVIVPSLWYENFPMVIAEAFACGAPVICSRLGSMQEIVADGITGLHFTPGDSYDLAQKVTRAWTHATEMSEMGHAARREYEQRYTAERNYSLLIEIYKSALARTHKATAEVSSLQSALT